MQPYDATKHVLLDVAGDIRSAHERLASQVTPAAVEAVVQLVPEDWLEQAPGMPSTAAVRTAYVEHLLARLDHAAAWLPREAA